jgi:glucosylglycerol-phosphate synthase
MANPFSARSMDRAILQALEMGERERRDRMQELREQVRLFDINAWAKDQTTLFDEARQRAKPPAPAQKAQTPA